MNSRLLLLILLVVNIGLSQSTDVREHEQILLSGQTFKSVYNVFSDIERENYKLEYFENEENDLAWGNFISFGDKTFSTDYRAPCGNDCFTTVTGTYKFVSANRIQVYVETITRSGFCQSKSVEPEKVVGIFQITETETGMTLAKV